MVIISQYTHILNHDSVHLKLVYVNYISIKNANQERDL